MSPEEYVKQLKEKFVRSRPKTLSQIESLGMIPMNTETVPPSDNVVILGAGPSLTENQDAVINYVQKYNPTIIGTHYNFCVPSEYTMIIGKSVFSHNNRRLRRQNTIITEWVYQYNKKLITKHISYGRKYFLLQTKSRNPSEEYWNKNLEVDQGGAWGHWLGNCGFTATLAGYFFRPQNLLIVGFDGADPDGITFRHFDGVTREQKGKHRDAAVTVAKGGFLVKIIRFLNKSGTHVRAFKNDNLWGIDAIPKTRKLSLERL